MSKIDFTPIETIILYQFINATLETISKKDISKMKKAELTIPSLESIQYKLAVEMNNNIKDATNE